MSHYYHEVHDVANWVALGLFLLSTGLFCFLRWLYHFRCTCVGNGKSSFWVELYRTRLHYAYVGIIASLLLATLAAALLMEQGSVVREVDSQLVEWARWATYAVVHALLAYVIATWYWQKSGSLYAFVFRSTLYSLAWLFAALSTEDRRWGWYAIGWIFFLSWVGTLLIHFRRNRRVDTGSFFVKLTITVVFALYPIVLLLEPALLNEISQQAATWIYLALDFVSVVVFLVSAGLIYSSDPAYFCCDKEKCDCKEQCPCHSMPHGTHPHHKHYQHHHQQQDRRFHSGVIGDEMPHAGPPGSDAVDLKQWDL